MYARHGRLCSASGGISHMAHDAFEPPLQVVFIGVELDRDYYESLIDELVDHALAPRMVESREEKSSEEEES